MKLQEVQHQETKENSKKIFYGAITVFYKEVNGSLSFLIATNTVTGNISFVSGAQEDGDLSLEATAQRENIEELDLPPDKYILEKVDVKHEFIFGPNKKERAGCKGSYQVFIANLTNTNFEIRHTDELKSIKWMTEEEVFQSLTFADVVEVFKKTVEVIKSRVKKLKNFYSK